MVNCSDFSRPVEGGNLFFLLDTESEKYFVLVP